MNAVSLVWLAKTESGWKRFVVIMGRNGRIKKGAVLVDGKERNYPEGHFELRFYEGRKPKYKNVGTDATEAVNACDRHQSLLDAKTSATAAGVTVNEPEMRKTIKSAVTSWIKDTEDRGAMEAADVNATALMDFIKANPALVYLDEIGPDNAEAVLGLAQKARPFRSHGLQPAHEADGIPQVFRGRLQILETTCAEVREEAARHL